jgi:nucleotide-binding universal stress UspA family protein
MKQPGRRILVALDGSTEAAKALDLAIEMARAFNGELAALHVVSRQTLSEGERHLAENEYRAEVQQSLRGSKFVAGTPVTVEGLAGTSYDAGLAIRTAIGRAVMDRAEADARSRQVPLVETTIGDGDPASVILEVADRTKPDFLVVGSRGLGGIERLLLGSVSQKVSQSAGCTVVIVK